jgi:Fibronectin type III domain
MGLAAVGAVVVAAVVAVVVIAPWKSPPPVLKPTGLVVDASTTSSVAFRWSGPATGPEPTVYEILRDGQVIGQVPGTTTYYRETGLPPASAFQFQVIAIRGSKKSPRSTVLSVDTVTPPVSAAVLDQSWTANWAVTSAVPNNPLGSIQTGKTWTDKWTFTPDCTTGACNVTLHGTIQGTAFTASLTRYGAVYTGSTGIDDLSYCSLQSNHVDDVLQLQLQVQGGQVQGQAWTAKSWTGSYTLDLPYSKFATTSCYAITVKGTVSGSH